MRMLALVLVSALAAPSAVKGDDAAPPAAPAAAAQAASAAPARMLALGVQSYDWNGDGKLYKLIMEVPKGWKDPGSYTRLRIQAPGRTEFVKNGLAGAAFKFKLPNGNLLKSGYLALTRLSDKKEDKPVLLLQGYPFAGSPGKLTVIGLDASGAPQVLLDDKLDVQEIADFDGDGGAELAGRRWLAEEFGPNYKYSTYAPILVYSLQMKDGQARFAVSAELSESYNKKRGYPWAGVGPVPGDKSVVIKDKAKGTTALMSREEADKAFGPAPAAPAQK